jgi:hypothetical protein
MSQTQNQTTASTTRDARGRFQPGQSGNPAGKKPGTLNHATRIRLLLEDGEFETAGRRLIEAATAGNLRAIQILLDRVDPKPRNRPITLDMPDGVGPAERFAVVVRAMCQGEITPDEAKTVAGVLATEAKVRLHPTSKSPIAPAVWPQATTPARPVPAGAPDLHSACIWSPKSLPTSRAALLSGTSLSTPKPDGIPAFDLHRAAA